MTYLSFGTNKSDSKREMRCLNVARVALFRSFELGLCWPLAFLTRIRGHFAEVLLPLLHHEMTSFLNFGMHKPTQVMMPVKHVFFGVAPGFEPARAKNPDGELESEIKHNHGHICSDCSRSHACCCCTQSQIWSLPRAIAYNTVPVGHGFVMFARFSVVLVSTLVFVAVSPKKSFEAPKAAEERPADRPSASQLMRFSGLSSVPAKGSKGVRAERRRRRRGPYNLTWMRVPVDKCMNRPKMLNKANLRIDDEGEEPAAKRRGR